MKEFDLAEIKEEGERFFSETLDVEKEKEIRVIYIDDDEDDNRDDDKDESSYNSTDSSTDEEEFEG